MDDKNRNYQQNYEMAPQATVFSALDRSAGSRISEEGRYSLEHTSEAASRVVENESVPVSIYEGGNRFLGTRLRKQIVAIGVSAVVALTAAFGLVVANMLSGGKEPVQQPLTSLSSEDLRGVSSDISGGIGQITVNSPLLVNSKLTVTPSARPTVSQAGELYFDAETNRFMYYDGSSYQQIVNDQEFSQLSAIARSDAGTGLSLVGGVLSNAGVLSLQGQTGNVSFTAGSGVSLNGTQIANTGVLSIQGQSGNVSFTAGTGISLNGMAITNSGVTALSGTPGQVAVSGANGSVTISLPQSIATISSPTFQGLTLATALGLNSGGTGATASNFSPRGVVFYNGSHLVGTASPAGDGLCLVSTSSGPAFSSCSGTASVTSVNNFSGAITISAGSGITLNESAGTITVSALAASGVMSLQGLSGALTLANASASGSTITINNASTAQKGIASFNSSTFSVNNGNVSLVTCANDQILKYSTTASSWGCADDVDTDTGDGQGVTAISAGDGITVNANNPATPTVAIKLQPGMGLSLNSSTGLGLLNTCSAGQVLKYSSTSSAWECASDAVGTGDGQGVTSIEAGDASLAIDSSDSSAPVLSVRLYSNRGIVLDTVNGLGLKACADGQVLKYNGGQWICADDSDTATPGDGVGITSITAGDGIEVTPSSTSPTVAIKLQSGMGLSLNSTTGLGLLNTCSAGQVLKYNGNAWECSDDVDTSDGQGVTSVTATDASIVINNSDASAPKLSVRIHNNKGIVLDAANGLGLMACANDQILKYSTATNSWGCADDVDTNTGDGQGVVDIIAGDGINVLDDDVAPTVSIKLQPGMGLALNSTTGLGLLNTCSSGQVLKYNNSQWQCDDDIDTQGGGDGQGVTSVEAGDASIVIGGDNSVAPELSVRLHSNRGIVLDAANGLGLRACADGEVLKYSGSQWICGTDNDTVAPGDGVGITSITAGSGIEVTPSSTSPTVAIKLQSGMGLALNGATGLGLLNTCSAGQILKYNGSAWECNDDIDTDTQDGQGVTSIAATDASIVIDSSNPASPKLSVRLQNNKGIELNPTTGLGLIACANDQVLKYSTDTSSWGCASDASGSGVTGTGTAGRLVKFTGAGAVGDSVLGESGDTITLQASGATAALTANTALSVTAGGTNQNLVLNASGSGQVQIGGTSTGDILLGGGSGSTGCTVANASGNFTCAGSFNTTGQYQINGVQISSADLSNDNNLAKLNASNIFTGQANTFNSDAATQNALLIAANNLTSGSGLKVTTASTSLTNGNLVDITQTSAYDSTFNTSSKLLNVSRTVTGPLSRGTVTLDSTSQYNSSSPSTWNHTVADHENDILIVTIGGTRSYNCCNIEYPSSVTYGGQPMTRVTAAMYPDDFNVASVSQWVMYDPPTGTHLISVTASDFYFATTGLAASYYNVDQDNPIASIVQTNDVYPPTFAVSASAEQAVIDGLNSNRTYNTFATQNPNTSGQIKTGEATFGPASGSSGTHISLATKLTTSYAIGPKTTMGWTGEGYNAYVAIVLNAAMVPGATDGTLSGSVANISSDCAGCTETGNILNLQQSNVSATGAVLNIQNAGAGPDIQLGNGIIRAGADSTTAMRIQNASGNNTLFTADTTNDRIVIGDGSSTATALVLDSAASAPTGVNGAMYYDTTEGKFKFYQNGEWVSFGTEGGGGATLQQAYNASVTATPSSPATILTSGPNNGILVKAGASADSTSLFRVQNAGSVTLLNVDSVVGTVTLTGTSSADALSVVGGTSIAGNLKVTQTSSNAVIQFTTTPSNTSSTTTVGPNSPTVGVNDASAGSGAWSSPSNALTNNGATAVATMNSTGSTNYLKLTGFGFSIPSDAQIAGVTVDVKAQTNNQSGAMDVRLVDNGTPTGSVVTYNGIISSVTSDYYTVGSSSSTWGNALTPAKINSSNFGIAIQYRHDVIFGTQTLSIDHARVTIYYRAGGNLVSRTWTVGQAQNGTGEFRIAASSALGTNDYFKIDALTGNVGIGTVAPIQNKLGVNGSIGAAGSITASSTPDIAETIPAADDVEPGDVVSADPDHSVRAIKSQTSYDSTMIGIISDGTSAFKINSHAGDEAAGATGKYLVLAGRIPVKVTNEGGPIKPGDYLTSSSTPGYAMKATKAGPTVGKALASFDGETGTVMVHANLSYYEPPIATVDIQGQTATFHEINISGMATINTLHVTSSLTVDGDIIVGGHVVTNGNTPDVEALIAAGSNAAVEINGNDTSGTITLTTGANPSAGNLARIMFNKPYGKAPKILISAANDAAADLRFYRGTTTTDDTLLRTKDTPGANTTYQYDYFIAE